ncbi:MAG: nickel pincer cofactor biosynthesis protein LarC [Firmicutes bacterium]|nr:nickel pincer cofactor biosynthesis protein LarC [Bacillota bacterium]
MAEATGDIKQAETELNALGIPGVEYKIERSAKMGVTGTSVRVLVNGEEEEPSDDHDHDHHHHHDDDHDHDHHHYHDDDHDHEHEHDEHSEHDHHHDHDHDHDHDHHHHHDDDHDHDHHHHHASMADIEAIIDGTSASDKVKRDAKNIYKIIAEAESKVHGTPVTEIHFHEVGAMDAVADVTACCYLMDKLGVDRIVASAVRVGAGHVHCAHGVLPVPAPATANILMGIPTYAGDIKGEMCTPTGAAVIKYFAKDFGEQPIIRSEAIGYGFGKKDFPQLNAVRVILGEEEGNMDNIVELSVNLDDMTPERIGFACDRFFELGAVEVYTTSVHMKKFRPGVVLTVMCREEKRQEMVQAIFKYTTTLGIRENISKRYALRREVVSVDSPFGEIHQMRSTGYGVTRVKYEYDDLAAIAHGEGVSIEEVIRAIEKGENTYVEREEEDF